MTAVSGPAIEAKISISMATLRHVRSFKGGKGGQSSPGETVSYHRKDKDDVLLELSPSMRGHYHQLDEVLASRNRINWFRSTYFQGPS